MTCVAGYVLRASVLGVAVIALGSCATLVRNAEFRLRDAERNYDFYIYETGLRG